MSFLRSFHGWVPVAVLVGLPVVAFALHRLVVLLHTLPALALVPLASRRLANVTRRTDRVGEDFLLADGAPAAWLARRQRGLDELTEALRDQTPASIELTRQLRDGFSDLRFTDASRVPFHFAREARQRFNLRSVVTASRGPYLQQLDGRWTLDVSGSYGLNVAGFDQYKSWIARGWDRVKDLGPVLGPVHPVVADNVARLRDISGLDEVSFHMSGTEAVMAAVRLARFNTRRTLIVCFSGAYHGWWDGVQPGLGNERDIPDCLTLKDLHPSSLDVIRRRAKEIAAVLVNPVQAFHPNSPPPSDAVLVRGDLRKVEGGTGPYASWLRQLREVCRASAVPLIFDEVYTGFRLAPGGAQEYFGVRADLVVYGKTVAGGMPIGVVCGKSRLMRRLDPDHPLRMAYVVGTFSAHPLVMGAMNEFLRWVAEPAAPQRYEDANRRCTVWVRATNHDLADAGLPVRVANLGTIWTVLFTDPGRFDWLLQYYLRAQGITLSWVGTGRCLVSMDFTDADYLALQAKLTEAVGRMKRDGWWLTREEFPHKERSMKRRLVRDLAASLVPAPLRTFYTAVMKRKDDDHHASHNNVMNQYLHLVSSSAFIYCYAIAFTNLTTAMFVGLASLFVRQFGHAVLEPACHDQEKLLLGYDTRSKTLIVLAYAAIPLVLMASAGTWTFAGFRSLADQIALQWFRWTLIVVLGRVAYLTWKHDVGIAMVWFVKLVTDPITDIIAYFPRRTQRA
ncbi:MAG TPA: aminotransferase class III-fold pyridoxal phosphate-dependent enzyme [Vicinamibacterales bacterium]|nr:aminotransferase class III-fold pyridoxal phosphate-dependent enzyme [Vicinamibacterales bacterium]